MSDKSSRPQQVFTLLVEVGRAPDDGLPDGATGAALLCYATGVDEAEAVRETVAVLRVAELAVLEVEGHGSRDEQEAAGVVIAPEEAELMDRALAENAVIVAQMTAFYGEPDALPEPALAAPVALPPKAAPRPALKAAVKRKSGK